MELSALLYLLCSSKASKIDFLELGFRNWGCAPLKVVLMMSLYTCCLGGQYAVFTRAIWRIAVWLGVGTTFDILNPYRILTDLRYGVWWILIRRIAYNILKVDRWILIRRIVEGNTAYWSSNVSWWLQVLDTPYPSREYGVLVWQRPDLVNNLRFLLLSSGFSTIEWISIIYSCIAAFNTKQTTLYQFTAINNQMG